MAKSKVLILGYGEMGHAMQTLLADRHELSIWDKFPAEAVHSVVLEAVAPQADVVIFCLPVNPHHEIALNLAPLLKKSCLCLSIAKGLDESGRSAAQVFAAVFGRQKQDYALLYGPMIAEEIHLGRAAFAQLGCSHPKCCEQVAQLFAGSALQLTVSADITGISWSVILKNVYAMVFGMADELQLGDNMRGFLLVFALRELDSIVVQLGGAPGSAYGLAGLGDLVTTATSEDSHHHALGRKLARGDRTEIRGEGVHTLEMVAKHALFLWQDYALFRLLHNVVLEQGDPGAAIAAFSRTAGAEKSSG